MAFRQLEKQNASCDVLPGYLWCLLPSFLGQKIPRLTTGWPVTVTNRLAEAGLCPPLRFPPSTQNILDITQAAFILGRLFIMVM